MHLDDDLEIPLWRQQKQQGLLSKHEYVRRDDVGSGLVSMATVDKERTGQAIEVL